MEYLCLIVKNFKLLFINAVTTLLYSTAQYIHRKIYKYCFLNTCQHLFNIMLRALCYEKGKPMYSLIPVLLWLLTFSSIFFKCRRRIVDLMRREHSSDYQVFYGKHKFKFPNLLWKLIITLVTLFFWWCFHVLIYEYRSLFIELPIPSEKYSSLLNIRF